MAGRPRHWCLLALTGVALSSCGGERPAGPPEVGDVAPVFTAQSLSGEAVSLDDFLGEPFMLNIWATWCGPCRKEMPGLQELHDTYASEGFQVIGISVDNRAAKDAIEMFVNELALDFPIYHDPEAGIQDRYFLLGLPGTFLIDRNGLIVRKWTGPLEPMAEDVQESVRALL